MPPKPSKKKPPSPVKSRINYPITPRVLNYREVGLDYAIPPHREITYQWYFVVHGAVNSAVGNETFSMGDEEGMVVTPDIIRDRSSGGKAAGYIVVNFINHELDLSAIENRVHSLPEDLRPDLHALLREIRSPGTPNSHFLTTSLLVRLLIGIRRDYENSPESGGRAPSSLNARNRADLVQRLEIFMQRNLHRPLTRDDMAEAVHLSAPHVARVFRQSTGISLGSRLTELRMEMASRLLLESTIPITQIALEVGFRSFSHFTQTFRRKHGASPSDFRKTGGYAGVDLRDTQKCK